MANEKLKEKKIIIIISIILLQPLNNGIRIYLLKETKMPEWPSCLKYTFHTQS